MRNPTKLGRSCRVLASALFSLALMVAFTSSDVPVASASVSVAADTAEPDPRFYTFPDNVVDGAPLARTRRGCGCAKLRQSSYYRVNLPPRAVSLGNRQDRASRALR